MDRSEMLREITRIEQKWWRLEQAAMAEAGHPQPGSAQCEMIQRAHEELMKAERDRAWQGIGLPPVLTLLRL